MSTLRWLTVTIGYFAIILPPIARILQRAGFSRWWYLFWAVPPGEYHRGVGFGICVMACHRHEAAIASGHLSQWISSKTTMRCE
jgi:hypothetical protein